MEKLKEALQKSWWFRDLPPVEGYTRLFRVYVSNGLILKAAGAALAAVVLFFQVVQPLVAAQLNPPDPEPPVVEDSPSPEGTPAEDESPPPVDEPPDDTMTPDDTAFYESRPSEDEPPADGTVTSIDENATASSIDPASLFDSMFNVTVNVYGDVEIVNEGMQ